MFPTWALAIQFKQLFQTLPFCLTYADKNQDLIFPTSLLAFKLRMVLPNLDLIFPS